MLRTTNRVLIGLVLTFAAPVFGQTTQPAVKYYDLQAAINKAVVVGPDGGVVSEKILQLPAGDYHVAKPAKIPAAKHGGAVIKIVGHGRGTTLRPSKTFPGGPLLSLEGAGQGCILSDFRIVNESDVKCESAIRLSRPPGAYSSGLHSLTNIWAVGRFTRACIDVDGSEGCTFTKVIGESLNTNPALLLRSESGGMQTYQELGCCWTNNANGPSVKIHACKGIVSDLHFRSTVLNGGAIDIAHDTSQCEMLSFEDMRFECGVWPYCFRLTIAPGLALGPISVQRCMLESKISNWKSLGAVSQLTWIGNKVVHDFANPTIDAERLDYSGILIHGSAPQFIKAKTVVGNLSVVKPEATP